MNITSAKKALDKVIHKGRVHFYKPFQIAEILRHHRAGDLSDLTDLNSYKNVSRRWRDDVSNSLVGRHSTSSARYQDDVFNDNACPPQAIAVLGAYNKEKRGLVEAYIYKMFEARVSSVATILAAVNKATPDDFDITNIVRMFEQRPGLKRSIDKVYEIVVYALFSTIVRALELQVKLSIGKVSPKLITDFKEFITRVIGLKEGETSVVLPAKIFRLGSTNAADLGLDMVSNFGPAIQVKHLTLDSEAIADICEGITADRVVIVCKRNEIRVLDAVIRQLGLKDRVHAIVTFSDLQKWYGICLNSDYRHSLGKCLLADFRREFSAEFPSLEKLPQFLKERGYSGMALKGEWEISEY